MCLIYSAADAGPAPGTPEFGSYLQAYGEYTAMLQEKGAFVAGDALQPVATATTVTRENGKTEKLGGYYLIECESLDSALELASRIPTAEHGRIEVRPIMTFD